MDLIFDIVKKLKRQEIRRVKHQIAHAPFEFEKVGKLFDLVTRYKDREEAFYSQKLYGREPDNTFRVTKSRLKRMLENVLLHDKSLSGYEAQSTNVRLLARKKLLQGEVLLGRGAYAASKNLLLQVISSARKFALPDEHFHAELLLYRNQSTRTSVKEFEKHTEELLRLNELRSRVNEAVILHYSISNLLFLRTLKKKGLKAVRKKLNRIKELMLLTDHPLAKNVYYLSEVHYHQITNQFEGAREFCEKYLAIIQQEPSQYTAVRLGDAYLQLSQISLQLNETDRARDYSGQALKILSKKGINYLLALELAFRIEFTAAEYPKAQQHLALAMGHPQFDSSRNIAAKWHYFHACLLFRMGKFKEAYMELNHTAPLLADKYGMNLYIRLLEIMIMHEMKNFDLMETKILNMRQFVKRTQRNQALIRSMTLIKILMSWYKHSYDFEATFEAAASEIERLNALNEDQPYLASSDFELIRLEQWMEGKVPK